MIKLDRSREACPDTLITKGTAERENLRALYLEDPDNIINAKSSDLFKSSIYGSDEVKAKLKTIQNGKCCFCESYVCHVDYGDVEHYRPKGGWIQDKNFSQLNKPGYFLEAYKWENLMFSCTICNQREKKNYYPLINQTIRTEISVSYNINVEQPMFLNPYDDEPENHLEFVEEIPRAKNGSERGQISIEYLGLDRDELNEMRRDKLKDLKALLEVISLFSDQSKVDVATDILKRRIKESILGNKQYVLMIKNNFPEYI